MTRNNIYTTADEACFIDGLGRHSETGRRIGALRALAAYVEAATKRSIELEHAESRTAAPAERR